MSNTNQQSNNEANWNADASFSNYLPWYASQHFNQNQMNEYNLHRPINPNIQGSVLGLQALFAACTRIYPDQPNPLQVTARLKYWLGGPDPLDYISMYWNPGRVDINVPPHWHYVSFGLSDLHGDGRVHPIPPPGATISEKISGMGLELSFRMIGEPGNPPTWPAALLQRLATYVFRTGNRLCVGDHISWHSALDGTDEIYQTETYFKETTGGPRVNNPVVNRKGKKKSKIRHMLVAQDSQLGSVNTPLGKVEFVQIVGITDRELKASQKRGGQFVLDALSADIRYGGPWLVTNPQRTQSVTLPETTHSPSDLSGVAASCRWEYWEPSESDIVMSSNNHRNSSELPKNIKEQIKSVLQKGLSEINLHSKEPTNTVDEISYTDLSVNQKSDPVFAQSQTQDSINDCKMSTDSIKNILNHSSSKNFSAFHKNNFDEASASQVTNMSTDSFEMSKMGAALIEDVIKVPNNIKKELDMKNQESDENNIKSNLETCSLNDNIADRKNIIKNCDENNALEKESQLNKTADVCNCLDMNKNNTPEQLGNKCDKCMSNIWTSDCTALPGIHLIFDKEAGALLPLALRCRILHGRHFTWTAVSEIQAITFVATTVSGALVSAEKPIVANNGWLQILISDTLAQTMADELEPLLSDENDDSESEEFQPKPPIQVFRWCEHKLKISILNNI